ncbi:MAG: hypothetical protein ACE5D0_07490 [Fidelibacterota bacterium]
MNNNDDRKERAEKYSKIDRVKDDRLLDTFLSLLSKDNNYENILEIGIGTNAVASKVVEIFRQRDWQKR